MKTESLPLALALIALSFFPAGGRAASTITSNLVVHLKFDGNLKDSTTNGLNGLPMALGTVETNGPTFQAGLIGQAVHIVATPDNKTNDYVTLGYPALLHFGSDFTGDTTDFSVTMWVKILSSQADEPFISNKNWDSSNNQGWIISNEGDGVRVTLRDDVNTKKDMSGHAGPQLEDGNWHHLAVTFQRTNTADTYIDGVLDTGHIVFIGPDPGNTVGSLDTDSLSVTRGPGWAVNLGQDGTGLYNISDNAGINCLMDDVGIWRRVLTADEVAQIYGAGLQGLDIESSPNATAFFKNAVPAPNAVMVAAAGTLSVQIQSGAVPINTNSITLTLDGQAVAPNIARAGGLTTVNYAYGSPQPLAPFSLHTAVVTAADTSTPPKPITNTWSFTVTAYTVVPAAYAAPLGSATLPGMLYRSVWASGATSPNNLDNSIARTEAQLAGTLIDPGTGAPYTNDATNGPISFYGINGYSAVQVVNFEESGAAAGDIAGDQPFPGLPVAPAGGENDSFATEAITFIPLQPGYYRFGVNSDDGFALSVGNPAQSAVHSIVLGQFDGGRAAADSTMDFQITQAGVYGFRLIYEQGAGGASEEWWSADLATGVKTLINATNSAFKAYQSLTGQVLSPYVAAVSPAPGQTVVSLTPTITAQVVDGVKPLVQAGVQLALNGSPVTGLTASKITNVTTFTFQVPTNAPLALGTTNTVSLTYSDGTVTNLDHWSFVTHPAITVGLVAHLPFDGDYHDTSGNGVDGTPVAIGTNQPAAGPTFDTGLIGQAVHVIATSDEATNAYVSLGYPPLLRMGSQTTGDLTDFSVSFWEKMNSSSADEPFVSNKNWDSGNNFGWVISNESDGLRNNWHDRGGSGRKDVPSHFASEIEDGNWHHIVVTFDRLGFANTYVDGVLTNQMSIAPDPGLPAGNSDTFDLNPGRGPGAYAWNLGEDGTGDYAVNNGAAIDCLMDDVAIWRRLLAADEIASIYELGLAGKTFASPVTHLELQVGLQGGKALLSWTGAANVQLQSNPGLSAAGWQNVAGTLGASGYTNAVSAATFYRLIQQ